MNWQTKRTSPDGGPQKPVVRGFRLSVPDREAAPYPGPSKETGSKSLAEETVQDRFMLRGHTDGQICGFPKSVNSPLPGEYISESGPKRLCFQRSRKAPFRASPGSGSKSRIMRFWCSLRRLSHRGREREKRAGPESECLPAASSELVPGGTRETRSF